MSTRTRLRPVTTQSQLFYPMQLKVMNDEETREYHLKKLYELSLKSVSKKLAGDQQ